MRARLLRLFTILMLLAATAAAQAPSPPPTQPAGWAPLAFLFGDWDGIGSGAPGESAGRFSLREDLGGNVLVRRNEADTPRGRHEDLMVVYHAAPGPDRAIYFDNEGHVIHYTLEAASAPGQATFVSDAVAGMPRFRLTYRLNDDGTVNIAFAIAPPGAAEFKTYLEGAARRR